MVPDDAPDVWHDREQLHGRQCGEFGAGRPMSPSFNVKHGRRYHYYVSSITKDINRGLTGVLATPIARIPARRLETAVRDALRKLLMDKLQLTPILDDGDVTATRRRLATAAELARHVGPLAIDGAQALLRRLMFSLTVHNDCISASVSHSALLATLDHVSDFDDDVDRRIALLVDTDISHRKRGARLIIAESAAAPNAPDPKLVTLLGKAHQARSALFSNAAPRGNRHIERLARLAYLAPDITAAILDGTQPATLTSRRLLKLAALPLVWAEQRKMLGFA